MSGPWDDQDEGDDEDAIDEGMKCAAWILAFILCAGVAGVYFLTH